MRNCSKGGLANMSCKSMLAPCSLSGTLRWVFADEVITNLCGQNLLWLLFECCSQCQVDVHISEKAGISFLDIKGGLNTNALANAVTRTIADKEVVLAVQVYIILSSTIFNAKVFLLSRHRCTSTQPRTNRRRVTAAEMRVWTVIWLFCTMSTETIAWETSRYV